MTETVLILAFLLAITLQSIIVGEKQVALTIYNNNFAVVKQVRDIYFTQGESELQLSGVSPNIQPQTVTFKPLSDPSTTKVYEQSLVNGVLSWKVWSDKSKVTPGQIVYRTTGFQWSVDYTLTLNQLETMADLGAWVMIENNSGKKYEKAKIKLVSGQINIITKQPIYQQYQMQRSFSQMANFAAAPPPPTPQFTQNSLSDFQIYTLNRPISLSDASKKQVEFIPKIFNITVKRIYQIGINVGGYNEEGLKVKSRIEFVNQKRNQLGIPLPKGVVRMYKEDSSDGSVEFIGETKTEYITPDQNAKLEIGNAYDIVIKKVSKFRKQLDKNGSYDAVLNVKVTNRKPHKAQVIISLDNSRFRDNMVLKGTSVEGQAIKISNSEYQWTKVLEAKEVWEFQWKETYLYPG